MSHRSTYSSTHAGRCGAATALSTRSWSTESKNARMSRSITQSVRQHRCRHALPRPAPTDPAGTRTSPGGRSAPTSGSSTIATTVCAIRSATVGTPEHPDPLPSRLRYLHRPAPAAGSSSPTTSDSTSCRGCPSGPASNAADRLPRRHPPRPCCLDLPYASHTSCLEITNGLPSRLRLAHRLLPTHVRLATATSPDDPSPSLHPRLPRLHHYYETVRPVPRDGTQPLTVSAARRHSLSPDRPHPVCGAACRSDRFPRSVQEPQTGLAPPSCRTPPGQ